MSQLLPYSFSKANQILLSGPPGALVALTGPQSTLAALGEVCRANPGVASVVELGERSFAEALQKAHASSQSAASVVGEIEIDADLGRLLEQMPEVNDLLDSGDDAPIVRMLNALLTQAARDGASDVQIEPYERSSSVRFRIDGRLREVVSPNKALHAALISRLKVLSDLDIAEKRLPQDGRIALRIGQRSIDVRVSTLPGPHGERAVLRLLDKSQDRLDLESLGMSGLELERFCKALGQPHGILLVTGPTGSGKTTTLYAALRRLDSASSNIMTVEDPIEYELPGIGQTQVNAKIDMTFAKALRSILRQDPDVIMIGEIRDFETAQIAIQASLTGHLVLATLHTNDAPSAVARLVDMGVEPYLLGSSLLGVLAQRLVRKACASCAGAGCPECSGEGYCGRMGLYEYMAVDARLKELIHSRAPVSELSEAAKASGMRLLVQAGEALVHGGLTTREEVMRVAGSLPGDP